MQRRGKAFAALLTALLLVTALIPLSAWADGIPATCGPIPGENVEVWDGEQFVWVFIKTPDINDRYLYINHVWAGRIGITPENGDLAINTEEWYSFNTEVAEALAKRPDITLEFDFLDFGGDGQTRLRLKLPAGTDLVTLMDGKETMEFTKLAEVLGVDTPVFRP
jgi:hypothetical protein